MGSSVPGIKIGGPGYVTGVAVMGVAAIRVAATGIAAIAIA
jgi:hypothetical protein